MREIGSESGALAQNPSTAHFGLGATSIVDSLIVYWPSGIVQREIPGFPADRRITIPESTLPAGGPGEAAAGSSRISTPAPNPFFSATRFTLELARAATARVRIFDPSGRLVRTLAEDLDLPAGRHRLTWNGTDGAGRTVAPGVYFCRVEAGGLTGEFRVVRLQ